MNLHLSLADHLRYSNYPNKSSTSVKYSATAVYDSSRESEQLLPKRLSLMEIMPYSQRPRLPCIRTYMMV